MNQPPKPPRVVAIDPATITGACWTDGRTVDRKTWTLTRGNRGKAVNELGRLLRDFIVANGCDLIAYEEASFGSNNRATAAYHNGLRGVIEGVAAEFNLPTWPYTPSNIKAQTTNNGKATKEQMMKAVETFYGIQCANDNEADAVAIAMLAVRGVKPAGMVKRAVRKRLKKLEKRQLRAF